MKAIRLASNDTPGLEGHQETELGPSWAQAEQ